MSIIYKQKIQRFQNGGQPFDIHSFYASNRGADMNNIYRLFASMGFNESRGRRTQVQNLNGGGAGAGHGFLQYETEDAGGSNSARTAYNRYGTLLRSQGKQVPAWYTKFGDDAAVSGEYDFSVLGKPEQLELSMADHLYGPSNEYLKQFISGKIDAGTFWAKAHKKSGATQEEIDRVNEYYNSMSTERVNNILYTDKWIDEKDTLKNENKTQYSKDNYIIRKNRFGHRCTDGNCEVQESMRRGGTLVKKYQMFQQTGKVPEKIKGGSKEYNKAYSNGTLVNVQSDGTLLYPQLPNVTVYGEDKSERSFLKKLYNSKFTLRGMNPFNLLSPDLSSADSFDDAWLEARRNGYTDFRYSDAGEPKKYSTRSDLSPNEQMKKYGITDEVIQNTDNVEAPLWFRKRAKENILPMKYGHTVSAIKALVTNSPEKLESGDTAYDRSTYEDNIENNNGFKAGHIDAWNLYNRLPQKYNTYKLSNHKPSVDDEEGKNHEYLDFTDPEVKANIVHTISDNIRAGLTDTIYRGPIKQFTKYATNVGSAAGTGKFSFGKDKNGDYVSFYDIEDIAPIGAYNKQLPIIEDLNVPYGNKFRTYSRAYYKKREDGTPYYPIYSDDELIKMSEEAEYTPYAPAKYGKLLYGLKNRGIDVSPLTEVRSASIMPQTIKVSEKELRAAGIDERYIGKIINGTKITRRSGKVVYQPRPFKVDSKEQALKLAKVAGFSQERTEYIKSSYDIIKVKARPELKKFINGLISSGKLKINKK